MINSIFILIAVIIGYLIGRQQRIEIKRTADKIKQTLAPKPQIKVLHKAEPTTYKEKQQTAIKEDKQIIKTFYK